MNTLDHLTASAQECLKGTGRWDDDRLNIVDYFHANLDSAARLHFDGFLVRTNDPLAYQAGTPESRFKARVLSMVRTERERIEATA